MQRSGTADVVIAGGGGVGLSLAVAIRHADRRASVVVVDGRPAGAAANDARASAIAGAARRMLTRLGVWHHLADTAEPIREMVVTDSKLADVARPTFLTFDGDVEPGEPFAHMVPNGAMAAALEKTAEELGVVLVAPDWVADFAEDAGGVDVVLGSGGRIRASLLVAADGARSKLRGLAGIGVVRHDYGQSGIVTTVAHERPHEGRAVEHFLPGGPFAILPLKGNRSSIVWTEPTPEAERLVRLDDFTFEVELERRFGRLLGQPRPVGPRAAYPLALTLARRFVAPRFALAGDAAHGIHPIAGQGLNLGFRDAAALAEVIVEARRLGLDPGALDVLARYERWRRFDTVEMGLVTDVLNGLFRTDLDPLRLVRDVGLGLVDRLPGLKRLFIREAAGLAGSLPRLMRGEAI
jgi:2-octaprenyl-6-methoxyphenol hydroxylase